MELAHSCDIKVKSPLTNGAGRSRSHRSVLSAAHTLQEKGKIMAKMVHSMIRVLDEARSVQFYASAFGLEVAGRFDFDDFALIYLKNEESGFELELTVNQGRSEPYSLGDGYGHLAVTVADLAAEHARMMQAGLAPGDIKEMRHRGQPMARFFFITDPDGYKTEVIEASGRFA
ncbi:VOC family protein [Consotaella aegiceratis]|uniref:VOC family protein n=1 Tax=Consotaella aegiceratis TaxID=3097961 RepID=UPI002F3E99C7